ncbi:SgcJ/EcaC family oxidoreductase [Leptolyngbya sp. NK1-12]|uniref:SgcJ/EcaC family oxidoreductase n=1 Tax=Leptolyngbya sp. NK1-12 TaxID=2547451 RepID=A0AA97AHT0_9CYAN|nr:SgcJ/EcaC family oxidoreductase [Leptolyngbya sp. NK1-12]WNZ25830.1 SgcJ/EcaC family oxidoreductase [Leptolyngbya sp. NK1-12]
MSNRLEKSPLHNSPSDTEEINQFIATLEDALNNHDADAYNHYFTNDISWGSPNGVLLQGLEPLHTVHKNFLEGSLRNSTFRYTIHNVKRLTPDTAYAHVQLVRTNANAEVESDELCLYVLIRKQEAWWVCAGHNTRVQLPHNAGQAAPKN